MKLKLIALCLALGLLLCGCTDTGLEAGATTWSPWANGAEAGGDTQPDAAAPAAQVAEAANGRLQILQTGPYTGLYPEDGSDEAVTSVAALLIQNVSDQACRYCSMEYIVDGQKAHFQVSELPAWGKAWVLETSRLTVSTDSQYTYVSDIAAFRETAGLSLADLPVTGGSGELTLTNNTAADLEGLAVYYKLLYDGNTYLGGIVYRVSADKVPAGQSVTLPAGHFYAGTCEVVGIYAGA